MLLTTKPPIDVYLCVLVFATLVPVESEITIVPYSTWSKFFGKWNVVVFFALGRQSFGYVSLNLEKTIGYSDLGDCLTAYGKSRVIQNMGGKQTYKKSIE